MRCKGSNNPKKEKRRKRKGEKTSPSWTITLSYIKEKKYVRNLKLWDSPRLDSLRGYVSGLVPKTRYCHKPKLSIISEFISKLTSKLISLTCGSMHSCSKYVITCLILVSDEKMHQHIIYVSSLHMYLDYVLVCTMFSITIILFLLTRL